MCPNRLVSPDGTPPPPGSPRWSAGFCPSKQWSPRSAPTGLAPVERWLLHKQRLLPVSRPHRARPGGALASAPATAAPSVSPPPGSPRWSAGFCPSGAVPRPSFSGPQALAPPRPARWGRATLRVSPLVQKPPLHRDKLGGGGAQSGLDVSYCPRGMADCKGTVRTGAEGRRPISPKSALPQTSVSSDPVGLACCKPWRVRCGPVLPGADGAALGRLGSVALPRSVRTTRERGQPACD